MTVPTSGDRDMSVIIATRNRAGLLKETLGHIARQDVGMLAWEVIVVDNGSTDDTPAVIRSAADSLPLVGLREPRPGKNRAMNRALEAVRGRLLVFSDDDVIPAPGWLTEMARASDTWKDYAIFGGQVLLVFPLGTPEWLSTCATSGASWPLFSHPQPEGPIALAPFGPNYAVRRTAMANLRFNEEIGPVAGTNYAMGSETELLNRLMARGSRVIYVPSSLVYHVIQASQLTTAALFRRSFRSGRGGVRMGWDLLNTKPGRRVLGAPRHLWRRALEGAGHYLTQLPKGRRRRLAPGMAFAYLLGALYEHRNSGAGRASDPGPSALHSPPSPQ